MVVICGTAMSGAAIAAPAATSLPLLLLWCCRLPNASAEIAAAAAAAATDSTRT